MMAQGDEIGGHADSAPPVDPGFFSQESRTQRRRALAVRRFYRAVDERRWWTVRLLADSVRAAGIHADRIKGFYLEMAEWNNAQPDMDRYYREFYRAQQAGLFGVGRRARVIMISPAWGAWRLTPERAADAVKKVGWQEFVQHYAQFSWIEIDRANEWLATWLKDFEYSEWIADPRISQPLAAARSAHRKPLARVDANPVTTTPPVSGGIDPRVNAVRDWLASTTM